MAALEKWNSHFNKSSRFDKAQHLFRKIYYFLGTMANGCVSYLSEAVKKEPEGKLNQVVQPLGEKKVYALHNKACFVFFTLRQH